jgi:hypothetical protein
LVALVAAAVCLAFISVCVELTCDPNAFNSACKVGKAPRKLAAFWSKSEGVSTPFIGGLGSIDIDPVIAT